MPTIRIPGALRSLTNGTAEVPVQASNVRDALVELDRAHPGVATKLLDAAGSVKPFIRIYVGPEDIQALDGLDTKLAERDEIAIIPAIAGGSGEPATAGSRVGGRA
jgi:molybdopterin synthase sulfur carrier subunit